MTLRSYGPHLVTMAADTTHVPDPEDPNGIVEVPCLLLDGVIVWTAPADTYWDGFAYDGPTALDVVIDHLRTKLT